MALCATELVSHPWGGHRGGAEGGRPLLPRHRLASAPVGRALLAFPPPRGQLIIHIHHPKALRRAHRCSPDSNTTGLRHKARPRGLCGLTRAARWTSRSGRAARTSGCGEVQKLRSPRAPEGGAAVVNGCRPTSRGNPKQEYRAGECGRALSRSFRVCFGRRTAGPRPHRPEEEERKTLGGGCGLLTGWFGPDF